MRATVVVQVLLTVALATSAAHAETLTLEEATRLALVSSPRIQEAHAQLEGSRATVSLARSGYLPDANLAAVATAGFGGATQQLGVRGIINSPNTQNFGAGVEAGWTVYDFGRTSARVDAALASVDSAAARRVLAERAAALDAAQAFVAVMMAEEAVRATAAVIDLRTRGAEASRALARAGLRSEMDALLAIARAEEAKAALVVARADVESARLTLGALLDRTLPAAIVLSASEPTASDVDRATGALASAPRDPLHDVAAAELARAQALHNAANAEHLPRLVVAGSAGYAHRAPPDDPGYWAAGVAIVVPLFSYVAEGARAREAGASARGAAARASQADIELRTQRGRETASLRALASSVAAADTSVAAAKTALEGAEARYGAGQLSFAEADAARDAFVRIESTRRRLGLQAALALARLRIWSARPGESGTGW